MALPLGPEVFLVSQPFLLLFLPTVTLYGVPVATANSPQAQKPKMKSFMMAPSARSLTKTIAMRLTSEISDQNCEDLKDFQSGGNAKKDCNCAAKRRGKKCKKTDQGTGALVAVACPSACDLRCSCRNRRKAFKFNGKSIKSREIEESDYSSVDDDGNILADLCPKICSDCYKHRSSPPTEAFYSSEWTQLGSGIDGEDEWDESGEFVSMSSDGTRVAIGASGNDGGNSCEFPNEAGHVRVYKYNTSGEWAQLGSDIDGECDDKLGAVSISSDGTRVAAGAKGHDTGSGRVRVYEYASGGWTQLGSNIDGEAECDLLGFSVSMSLDGARGAFQS